MRIGIVGPEASTSRFRAALGRGGAFNETEEFPCSLKELPQMMQEIQSRVDGILFTGIRYVQIARRSVAELVPWRCPMSSEAESLKALLRARTDGYDISRIVHDLGSNYLAGLLTDGAGLDKNDLHLFDYTKTQTYEEYLSRVEQEGYYWEKASRFFLEYLETGEANIALSGSGSTVRVLRKKGFPAYYITPSEGSILAAFNDLLRQHHTAAEMKKLSHREAVLCLRFKLTDPGEDSLLMFRRIRTSARIETSILNYAHSISAAVEKQMDLCFHLYSTQAEVELLTEGFPEFGFLHSLQQLEGVENVFLGIGFGVTHDSAWKNGCRALRAAEQQHFSCFYQADEEEGVKGPFLLTPDTEKRSYDRIVLKRIAEKSGVGLTVLESIAKAKMQYGFDTFTSSELAVMCGLTVNNINRILIKLEDAGAVSVVGQQSFAETGRPRRVFRLKFDS